MVSLVSGPCQAGAPAGSESSLGVPISGGARKLTVLKVRTESSLAEGISFTNKRTYTPKDGYAFLIVDLNIQKIDPTAKMKIAIDQVALLDEKKAIHVANGGGWEDNLSRRCVFSVSRDVGEQENTLAMFTGDSYSVTTRAPEGPFSLVFVVRAAELTQKWQLQFQDLPLISLRLGSTLCIRITRVERARRSCRGLMEATRGRSLTATSRMPRCLPTVPLWRTR